MTTQPGATNTTPHRTVSGWAPTDKTIHRTFRTGSFQRGLSFITALAVAAEAAGHHPDIIFTFPTVIVTLTTHDEQRVTSKDLALAEQINQIWDTGQFSSAT